MKSTAKAVETYWQEERFPRLDEIGADIICGKLRNAGFYADELQSVVAAGEYEGIPTEFFTREDVLALYSAMRAVVYETHLMAAEQAASHKLAIENLKQAHDDRVAKIQKIQRKETARQTKKLVELEVALGIRKKVEVKEKQQAAKQANGEAVA